MGKWAIDMSQRRRVTRAPEALQNAGRHGAACSLVDVTMNSDDIFNRQVIELRPLKAAAARKAFEPRVQLIPFLHKRVRQMRTHGAPSWWSRRMQ